MGNSHISRFALRRRLSAFGLAALCLFAVDTVWARPLEAVRSAGALRVTVYTNYKPYSWTEGGRAMGIDVEIAEALAKAVGVNLDLFSLRADDDINDDLRNGVWRGTVFGAAPGDVMMHVPYDKAIELKNDRVALASPYHIEGLALAVEPAKAAQALDLSLFLSEKVAVDVGTLGDLIMISAYDQKTLPNVVHFRGIERASQAFENGEVAAFYGEASAVQSLARAGARPFAMVYPKASAKQEWPIGLAVRSDSKDLGDFLDGEMRRLESSGELQRIFARYGVDWRAPDAAP